MKTCHFGTTVGALALILTLAILSPFVAEASHPSSIEGVYKFNGEVRPLSLIRKENVYLPSPEGRARLAELKSQGFVCTRSAPQFQVCQKRFGGPTLPIEVSERIGRKTETVGDIVLNPLREPPALIFDGEIAQEWLVPQVVQVGATAFESHNRLLVRGVEKLKLGDIASGLGYEFVYDAAKNQILTMVAATVSNGRVSDEYTTFAVREQK